MSTGFGIAAVIVVVLSFFVPFVGIFGTGFAMVLAAIGALAGDRIFATITALVGAVSIFVFSPTVWVTVAADGIAGGMMGFTILILIVLALPFLAMFLNASGKIMLGDRVSVDE